MLVLASISESVVNATAHLVRDGGLPAIFLLMALSCACIPVPSEVVLLFAGFAVADPSQSAAHHDMTVLGVVIAAMAGSMVGSWAAYGVGRAGRIEFLHEHGHRVHIGPAQIDRADRFFARYGDATLPMDDALARAAVDLGGRPFAELSLSPEPGLAGHFFGSLAQAGRMAIHVEASGRDAHHTAEAAYKAVGRALKTALRVESSGIPSTKGTL